MNIHELEEDPLIIDWFKNVKAKPNTQRGYLSCMQEYTNFASMTPTALIEEAEAENEARVLPRKQKIKGYIIGFREYLENKGVAPRTVENRIIGVRSFYKSYDIVIPTLPRRDESALPLEVHKKIPDKEDIRKVLEIADPLERALILIGASSGLAVADICNLKINDFIPNRKKWLKNRGYDPETGITTLHLRREKTKFDFITFLTPEASQAILNYLEHRERLPKSKDSKKRYEQLLKQKVLNDDGYLFVSRHVSDKYIETHEENLRKLTENAVMSMYRTLCEDCQITTKKGVWNMLRSHNMRKWFNNRLKKAGCDVETKEFLMAHRTRESRGSYDAQIQDPEGLKEKYINFIPFLTIQKEFDPSQSKEYQRMEKKVAELKSENEALSVERYELIKLQQEIEKLKAEKEEVREAYWIEKAEDEQQKQVDEHFHGEELEAQRKKIDQLYKIINVLSEALDIKIDIDKPLTTAEKKQMKNAPDW